LLLMRRYIFLGFSTAFFSAVVLSYNNVLKPDVS
jgi:hypothetical protein